MSFESIRNARAVRLPASEFETGMGARPKHDSKLPVSRSTGLLILACCVVFVVYSKRRLYYSDLWAHLSYGRWMVEHRALPEFEIFMPLAQGVRLYATSWLSQVGGFLVHVLAGHTGLQIAYGLGVTTCFGVLGRSFAGRAGNAAFGLIGATVFLLVAREHLMIIRPQLAGLVCFCLTLALLERARRGRAGFKRVAVVFALWANLHPSFPAGLILISVYGAGRAGDLLWRTGRWQRATRDARIHHFAAMLGIASVAVLLNPYGAGLYREVFAVTGNPNLASLLDWQPLSLQMRQGRIAVATLAIVIVLLWCSPRRVSATEVMGLVVAGLGAWTSSRMIIWWAVLIGQSIAVHGHAVWRQRFSTVPPKARTRAGRVWSAVSVSAIGIAVLVSPATRGLLVGREVALSDVASSETPIESGPVAVREAEGELIFAPNTWGDYLVWISHGEADVLCTSHVHLIPGKVWADYLAISRGRPECLELLDRYGVTTVLVGRRRPALRGRLEATADWQPVYAGRRAAVFSRRSSDAPADLPDVAD